MLFTKFPIVLMLLVFACLPMGKARGGSGSGLEGVINISPTRGGPTRADDPSAAPLSNVTFVVEGKSGATTTFTTDDAGRFRISLSPGHYTISRQGEKPSIGHFGPFTVDVVAGKMTKVEWECDSGMR